MNNTKNNITLIIEEKNEDSVNDEENCGEFKIESSWKPLFENYDFDLDELYNGDVEVYPKRENLFKVFKEKIEDIKIVILGQDPYINENQADGMAFSVPETEVIPPSLKNIFKEIKTNFPERKYEFKHGNLQKWMDKGVFLLNCSLTTEKGKSGSHMDIWEDFTNEVIELISEKNDNCVFLLMGNYSKSKEIFIKNKNNVVKTVHPSPLSASKGFFGSKCFIEIEKKLGYNFDWQN